MEMPKNYVAFSDVPLYEPHADFLNTKYTAFDLIDLLGYTTLLSDIHDQSLINQTDNELKCENSTLSAIIALDQMRLDPKDISITVEENVDNDFDRLILDSDFSKIYQLVERSVAECGVDTEILTLSDFDFLRNGQTLKIFVKDELKYHIELFNREFSDLPNARSFNLLPFNSKRVSFVMANEICKSRPTILTGEKQTLKQADYAIPPEGSVNICTAVATSYLDDQAELEKILHFHSISSYIEAYNKQFLVLPKQDQIIEFMQVHNPAAASALINGEMFYSIIEQNCADDENQVCQLYQILIGAFSS